MNCIHGSRLHQCCEIREEQWQPGDPVYSDERDCTHPETVQWNPHNEVVQCHTCGRVYVPFTADPYSQHMVEALDRERQRANRLQLALDHATGAVAGPVAVCICPASSMFNWPSVTCSVHGR